MLNVDILGKEIYFLEAKTKQIKTGIIVGLNISTTGYALYGILTPDNKKVQVEEAHVHLTKEACEHHLENVRQSIDSAERMADSAKKSIDAMRVEVIGKPVPLLVRLAERILGTINEILE